MQTQYSVLLPIIIIGIALFYLYSQTYGQPFGKQGISGCFPGVGFRVVEQL